jgi:ERCC4-type nuclease
MSTKSKKITVSEIRNQSLNLLAEIENGARITDYLSIQRKAYALQKQFVHSMPAAIPENADSLLEVVKTIEEVLHLCREEISRFRGAGCLAAALIEQHTTRMQ